MIISIDELRVLYETSEVANDYHLNFQEFALLYRLMEGVKPSVVFDSLYLSTTTIYRSKQRIIRKLGASSFEHALILVGEMNILNKKNEKSEKKFN